MVQVPTTQSGYLISRPGLGVDSIQLVKDQPVPAPARGQVLVAIKAVSLNSRDWAVITNPNYPSKDNLIPCTDAAGEVVAVGDDVRAWSLGDRVMGQFLQEYLAGAHDNPTYRTTGLGGAADGVLIEYKVFTESALVRVPNHLSWEEAATLPCAGVTVWNSLFGGDAGAQVLLPGQTVLLQGTGGISTFGAQIAHFAGARVIITSSSDDKLKALLSHIKGISSDDRGAPIHTVNYKTHPDWEKEVLKITKGVGVDLVLEVGGVGTLEKSFASLKQGGVVAVIGILSAPPTALPNLAMLSLFKAATVRGILIGSRKQFEQLATFLEVSGIRPLISKVYKFGEARQAYEDFKSGGGVGKIVIRVGA